MDWFIDLVNEFIGNITISNGVLEVERKFGEDEEELEEEVVWKG